MDLRMGRQGKPDSVKAKANKHEIDMSKRLKTQKTPNSGAGLSVSVKGDAQDVSGSVKYVFDYKTVTGGKLVVDAEMVSKIWVESCQAGKHPALVLTLNGFPGNLPKDWILIPSGVFEKMRELLDIQG